MIVAPFFTGDVDMEVASKQHDVYGQTLWIIVSKCTSTPSSPDLF